MIVGSVVMPSQIGQISAASVLSPEQIMEKHGLSPEEFMRIEKQVLKATVLDALFRWPDGPHYDILGWRWSTCR